MAKLPLRGRLAPSPTGALHLGNARSLLLAWLSIRSRGGEVVLRMEDLDHPKVKPNTARQAREDLRWLGLDWDEGPELGGPYQPYTQAERIQVYREALERLLSKNLVYPCTCSRQDVENAQSAPHAGEESPPYPGTCRGRYPSYAEAAATLPDGRLPAWRFQVPQQTLEFTDGFCGRQAEDLSRTSGDFTIARHPEGAGYQLAVVVDDAAMGITEVLRGDDLLQSTFRQLLLYQALELQPPEFVHVPLVVGPDGRRLAKRHGDTRISWIREAGTPPERVVGLLAHWCGLVDEGTQVTAQDLVDKYTLSALPHKRVIVTDKVQQYLGIG
ncbi:MAG: tRNA glutamyl-Q(34) synthetase GluQRS [Planctomycetes bacterium]|nr:tRNA glutamyl-Q(34) synthetase GluQRS [Planctomycetota bacterium]